MSELWVECKVFDDVAILSGYLLAPAAVAVAAMTLEAVGGRSRRRASDIHMFAIRKK